MKFSKKFKKLYDCVVDTFSCRSYPTSDFFREDFILLSNLTRAFTDFRHPLSRKELNTYSNLRIASSSDDKQDIYLISFYSALSDSYFILLVYKNNITSHKLSRFFMIKNNSFLNFDTLFSSVSQKNELYICSDDIEVFLSNIRVLDLK